jgi:hypothetical protein
MYPQTCTGSLMTALLRHIKNHKNNIERVPGCIGAHGTLAVGCWSRELKILDARSQPSFLYLTAYGVHTARHHTRAAVAKE